MNTRLRSAFSLVELLVVITIIGIIGTFAVPAVRNILKSSDLTTAANMLINESSLARQHALTKSRIVEFRIYRFADPEIPGESTSASGGQFRAFQYFEIADSGTVLPVGKFKRLPDAMILNKGVKDGSSSVAANTLSSLLGEAAVNNKIVLSGALKESDPELPRGIGKKYDYVAFRFNPDGSTSLSPTGVSGVTATSNGMWFITIHALSELNKTDPDTTPPPNFVTWQIDPVNGVSKLLRPGLK